VSSNYQWRGRGFNPPTLDVASVKLFNVVLLPLDGLPTSPIKGSRGIVEWSKNVTVVHGREESLKVEEKFGRAYQEVWKR
jgi:hypothetical protein